MDFFTLLFLSLVTASVCFSSGEMHPKMGVCYGELGTNLPTPQRSIKLIQNLNSKLIQIFNTNPYVLKGIQNTNLEVAIVIQVEKIITNMRRNQTFSDEWVRAHVVQFFPKSKIRYLLIGDKILSDKKLGHTWFQLLPAMENLHSSLKKFGLDKKIKIGLPMGMDLVEPSFPPSNAAFTTDQAKDIVIEHLLGFLNRTNSFYFADVYTYYDYMYDPLQVNLDYALLQPTNFTYTDQGSGLTYTNLLDQKLDAVVFAMTRMGYPNIPLFISGTGWPTQGSPNQPGANIYNAATYNRNVVKKFMAETRVGIPTRPGVLIPAMIYELYNEDQKQGPNFGLLYPNGSNVYPIDLSGRTLEYPVLQKPKSNGQLWCVAKEGTNKTALADAVSYACGQGNRTCDPIQPGGKCYKPNTLVNHARYAFSSYWSQLRATGANCSFNGLAQWTSNDPSYGSCKFPSINI